ncbi:MAG: MATE family efflux transporter [Clostridium sp.]
MLLKKFFRFVIPSIISMWIFALYTMADGIFVAHGIGEYALAAVNLSMPYTIFIFSIGLIMATGTSTLISIYMGEGKVEEAHTVFNQNLVILVIGGAILTIATLFNLERIAYFLGASAETIDYVKGYLGWISVFAIFFIVSYNMEILVKTDGSPKLQMFGVLICSLVNVVLDYIFVLRLHVGIEAAAISTGLAQVMSTGIFVYYFAFKSKRLSFKKFHWDLSVYKRIIPLGLSDGLTELSGGLVIFLFNHMIMKVIGSAGLVTYTVISYVNTLALNSMAGISQGIQPLVSYHYGAGEKKQYHKLLKYAFAAATVSGVFFLALVEFAPQLPVMIFLGKENEHLFSYSVSALRLYGISFLIVGFNVVAAGFFTAIDRPVFALSISSARSFILLSISLVIMAALFGENGIWLSTCVSEGLCLLVTAFFFKRYRKICYASEKIPAVAHTPDAWGTGILEE